MKTTDTGKPARNPNIKYINPTIPEFDVPLPKGQRYRVRVPDTLDLAERARHLLHAMNATTDPDFNAEIYWRASFGWNPPTMLHDASDWCEYKYYAPSLLLRQACGSEDWQDVEWHRMANVAQMQGPDGLMYVPQSGRPWATDFGSDDYLYRTMGAEHINPAALIGRLLESCEVYARLTNDPRWRERGKRIVDGLPRILVDRGDCAYLNKTTFQPGEMPSHDTEIPPPTRTHGTVWLAIGLTSFYRMTGYEPARELGLKLARFYQLRHGGFIGPNGEFQQGHGSKNLDPSNYTHFHQNTLTRVMLLNAGLANGDCDMIELARDGYEYGKAHGDTRMGYFPENLGRKPHEYGNTTEFCEVAEMIYMAVAFSKAGVADYWDDADRWLRNMFAEGQLLETDWAYDYAKKHNSTETHPYGVTEKVPERFRGAVGGWIGANDWQGRPESSIMTCCVGNTAIMLYRVWRDMITEDAARNRLSVHLLMNRASAWADIHSHIPYRGQVDVTLKRACQVALRMPEWAQDTNCAIAVNGAPATPRVEGRYLVVNGKDGDTIALTCPIAEHKETLHIVDKDYRVVMRGNEIVDIDPPGTRCPIFQRPEYRQDETRWIDVERFVSDTVIPEY